jgi:hypothetical protein
LADANFNGRIADGLRKRIPAIDLVLAHGTIPARTPDPEVLVIAMNLGRVLVSHDRRTMADPFYRLLEKCDSPGVIRVTHTYPIGLAIHDLELALLCSLPGEFTNRTSTSLSDDRLSSATPVA